MAILPKGWEIDRCGLEQESGMAFDLLQLAKLCGRKRPQTRMQRQDLESWRRPERNHYLMFWREFTSLQQVGAEPL
jgi:hypothetical protein